MNTIQTAPFVWHNGKIVTKDKLSTLFDIDLFMSTNLIEIFFTSGTEIMFIEQTIERINSLTAIYKLNSKLFADNTGETLINETRRLLIRNFSYKKARCFYLLSEGTGAALPNELLFLEPSITLFRADNYIKQAIVSNKFLKPTGSVMNLPTIEHEFRKVIRAEFRREGADDCIILNQREKLVESYYGNIFLIDGNQVITPSMESGCSFHLLRNVVINGLKMMGYQVTEMDEISIDSLFDAKELLIAGSEGIFSLKGIEYKRYFDTTRKLLLDLILK